jgi:hypothetical protein
MHLLLTALVLAAPLKVASAGFEGAGVDAKTRQFLSEQVAQRLASGPGVSVITPADVQTMLGLGRTKELLGCADVGGACLTELAGALGADVVLAGNVSRVGARFAVTLKLLDARSSQVLSVGTADVAAEDELMPRLLVLADAARDMLVLRRAVGAPVRWQPSLPLVAGLLCAGAGALLMVRANDELRQLQLLSSGPAPASSEALLALQAQGAQLRTSGKLDGTLAAGFFAVGGAAVVAAVTWWLWPRAEVQVAFGATRDGAALTVAGGFP